MTLSILGTGLVSPFGLTPAEHAFFLRAWLPPPPPSPFIGPDDKRVEAYFCRWIGAAVPVVERLVALAEGAIEEARRPLADRSVRLGLMLCTDRPRPGLTDADLRAFEDVIVTKQKPAWMSRFWGAAGVFDALSIAEERLREGGVDAVLVLAADSFISIDALTHHVLHLPTRWMMWPPTPSEGAAALVVATPEAARAGRHSALGSIGRSATKMSTSNDENDEIADGAAMSAALRAVAGSPVHYVFGQAVVGSLRRRECQFAIGRNPERFRAGYEEICLEASIGSVGGAAGAMSAVYGLAALRHQTLDYPWPRGPAFLAWAISRDGTRGMASIKQEGQ